MHALLESAPRVPLSPNRVFVDGERLARLLDQLRTSIPSEIQEAKGIIQQRDDILNAAEEHANALAQEAEQNLNDARQEVEAILIEAKESADAVVKKAEDEAQRRVSSHEIARKAEDRAIKIIEESQRKAEDARADADEYIFEVLTSLETELNRLLAVTRRGRSTLKRATALHDYTAMPSLAAQVNQQTHSASNRRPSGVGPVIGLNQAEQPEEPGENGYPNDDKE